MPEVVFLIGLPGSGKTTYSKHRWPDYVRVSSDDYIDKKACELGKTYSEIFKDYIKEAEAFCFKSFVELMDNNQNIVVDRTNMTQRGRMKFLDLVPDHYSKTACYVFCSDKKEHEYRLNSRVGKIIPKNVIDHMENSFQDVNPSEGFGLYITIDTTLEERQ